MHKQFFEIDLFCISLSLKVEMFCIILDFYIVHNGDQNNFENFLVVQYLKSNTLISVPNVIFTNKIK